MDGAVVTLHSVYDPENEARSIVDRFPYEQGSLLVILGLGLGYHVNEFIRKYPGINILVIERSREIYDMAEKHGVIRGILNHENILVGLSIPEVMEKISAMQIKLGVIPITVFPLSSSIQAFPEYYQPILKRLATIKEFKIWDKLRYSRFRSDRLNILVIDFDYFLYREIKRAFISLGHNVVNLHVNSGSAPGEIIGRITGLIVEHKPDFILTVNHLGFDEDGYLMSFLESIEMPVASWFVDSPSIIIKRFRKNISSLSTIFIWDRYYINDLKRAGFEHVEYLPLGTDEQIFKPCSKMKHSRYNSAIHVGFVGNSWFQEMEKEMNMIPEDLRYLVEKMVHVLLKDRRTFSEVFETLTLPEVNRVESLPESMAINVEAATCWMATHLHRVECIKALKGFKPVIHGDSYWDRFIDSDFILQPPLNYYYELPYFYNKCEINFNTTSLQMIHGVNQRVFDVPASGGFLLTDDQEALYELFDVDNEMATYKSIEEIPELVRFYLKHPDIRNSIARKARDKVIKEHTYRHRIENIIDTMRNRYADK